MWNRPCQRSAKAFEQDHYGFQTEVSPKRFFSSWKRTSVTESNWRKEQVSSLLQQPTVGIREIIWIIHYKELAPFTVFAILAKK
jgi:hypothetical protein